MYVFHISSPLAQSSLIPLWKLEPLLSVMRRKFQELWDVGETVAFDEQTVACKANACLKSRIKFKRAGDGFLVDSVCDRGYTYSFHFRIEPNETRDQMVSPLHNRCTEILEPLKGRW